MQHVKKKLRSEILQKRRLLSEEERVEKSMRISEGMIHWLAGSEIRERFGTLFSFVPFGDEPDILPVLEWCWREGIRTATPKTLPGVKALELRYVTHVDELVPGHWGIREPRPECPLCTDLSDIRCILVPGVAFDREGKRLGYGGGYYDRFFSRLAEQGLTPYKLAAAFALQIVPEVPADLHDVPVDAVLTEQGMFTAGGTPDSQ